MAEMLPAPSAIFTGDYFQRPAYRNQGTILHYRRRHTCALRASVTTSHDSENTRSDLTDGSSVLIDMCSEIILNIFEGGALFWMVSFSVDSTLSLPFWFYKSKLDWLYLYSISSLIGGLDKSLFSHYIPCNCHHSH